MSDLPAITFLADQAGLRAIPAGEFHEVLRRKQSGEAGESASYQQRFLLPVSAQKSSG
jgi:hypothetical protein